MIISVDFDGVLIDHKDIPTRKDWWVDLPMEGARESLKLLLQEGHEVYVCTARPKEEHTGITNWLNKHGFPYLEVTNVKKPYTDIYIDDRAYRFTNWNDIYKLFT